MAIIEITDDMEGMYARHIHNIARSLRKADYDELCAVTSEPYNNVIDSAKKSARKWIIMKGEEVGKGNRINIPVAIFGIVASKEYEKVGYPWMVATDNLKSCKKFVMKNVKKYIKIMMNMFDVLVNYVDSRNTESIKWLGHCGFTVEQATKPMGKDKIPFHRFYLGV
jgi:hypothetical protein